MVDPKDRTPRGRRRTPSPSVVPDTTVPNEPERPEDDLPPPVVTDETNQETNDDKGR